MKLVVRLFINAAALWAAAAVVDGMELTGSWFGMLVVAAIFGMVNAYIRPIITFFSFPALLLTLGLFTLVINAILLQITDFFSGNLTVDGFGTGIIGALVISVVSYVLSSLVGDGEEKSVEKNTSRSQNQR